MDKILYITEVNSFDNLNQSQFWLLFVEGDIHLLGGHHRLDVDTFDRLDDNIVNFCNYAECDEIFHYVFHSWGLGHFQKIDYFGGKTSDHFHYGD